MCCFWRMYCYIYMFFFNPQTENSLLPKRQLKRGHEICIDMYPSSHKHGSVENGMSPILVSFHLGENFP